MKKETSTDKMSTLSECMNHAIAEGYDKNFFIYKEALSYKGADRRYQPDAVTIRNFYRFEGESDPADNSILYLLETRDGVRGILLDAYGIYADSHIARFIKKIDKIKKRPPHREVSQGKKLVIAGIVMVAFFLLKRLSHKKKCACMI